MSDLELRPSSHGQGVFALRPYEPREVIVPFRGKIMHRDELPQPYHSVADHYVQIGPDTYMGPSGGLDDFINHSCDPNAGLRFHDNDITLIAIKHIQAGEEITWDYSTTMAENGGWKMDCECGSPKCRGVIEDFRRLPIELQHYYRKLGVVPAWLDGK